MVSVELAEGAATDNEYCSQRLTDNIYDNPEIRKLAYRCKMGDIIAMLDMVYFFNDCCEMPLRKLLDAYEENPVQENEDLLDEYLRKFGCMAVEVYMMWLVRAALYGNRNAELLLERYPYYKRKSYIPYAVLTGDGYKSIWNSDSLWKTGFIDIVRGRTDCRISLNKKNGYFDLWYVSYYCPLDEDGFGAEYEYESDYYNEFFCQIPVTEGKEISSLMMALEEEREAYWNKPENNAQESKYKRRLCTQG